MAFYSTPLQVPFSGKIIEASIADKDSVAEDWVLNIRSMYHGHKIIVGLNCKCKPHPVIHLANKVATLQLCIDTKCLILQLFYVNNIPQSIKNFLLDPNIVFVGVDIEELFLKLQNEYGLHCSKKIDVRALAKLHFPLSFRGKPGLKALAYQLLKLPMWKPKNVWLNSMESRVLDMDQIKFASIDAYVSYRIGHKLLKEI